MNEVKLKKCTDCGEEKENTIEYFYWIKSKNKFEAQCRICRNKKRKKKPKPENKYAEDGIRIKRCTGECKIEKLETIEFFAWVKSENRFNAKCRVCINKEMREYHKSKKIVKESVADKFTDEGIKIKQCTCCGEEKPETIEFYSFLKHEQKFLTQCKVCINKLARERDKKKRESFMEKNELHSDDKHVLVKKCTGECGLEKPETEEYFSYIKYRCIFNSQCKECVAKKSHYYYENNKEKLAVTQKQNYIETRDERNKRRRHRRKTDPILKCRELISNVIYKVIKKLGLSKMGQSTWKYMPYESPKTFVEHIEGQFPLPENRDYNGEIWMTWENHGVYDPTVWDENDSSTWKWQIDHRKPHSEFFYDSLEHPNLKLAWAPENIRPLRADINIKEGRERTRHNKF